MNQPKKQPIQPEDQVLAKMLATPPHPHQPVQKPKRKKPPKKSP
jgi:hypothetical protein